MTLTDLERTLGNVLSSGQLGTPVALRIHATLPGSGRDLQDVLGLFRPLVRLVAEVSAGQVQARQHPSGQQISVLWTDAKGRTVFLSLVSVPQARQGLNVLLVGNHGITQLSGGELWTDPLSAEEPPLWPKEIAESLKRGTSIAVRSS